MEILVELSQTSFKSTKIRQWSTTKKVVVGGGAAVAVISGIAAIPFIAGFTAGGVAAGSVAAGQICLHTPKLISCIIIIFVFNSLDWYCSNKISDYCFQCLYSCCAECSCHYSY